MVKSLFKRPQHFPCPPDSPAVAIERHGVVHDVVAGVEDAAVVVEPRCRSLAKWVS